MSYDPFRAVHVHYHGDRTLNTAAIGLAEEDYLLIHSCACSGTRQKIRELSGEPGSEGQLIFRADFDPVLTWQLRATILDWYGLADFHPGAPLSRQALLFANGGRFPFQFRKEASGEEVGVLYYEDPTASTDGGDTQELDFRITLEFSDLDTSNHPGEETYGDGWTVYVPPFTPETPVPAFFVELPAQTAAEITTACKTALLLDRFNGVDAFDGEPFTATLYDGDPAAAGTALTDPLSLTAWTTVDEPSLAYVTRARNQATVEWHDASWEEQECTHIRFARNGITVRDITLAAPLTIPAYHGVRALANALALQLTWPWDTTGLPAPVDTVPSRHFLRYVCGGTRAAAIPTEDLSLIVSSAGLADDFDVFDVPATSTYWTVSGLTVTPTTLTGTTMAGGDWDIEVVSLTGGGALVMREFESFTVTTGNVVSLTGSPILDLADTPD